MKIKITKDRYIGDGEPCFIIAEAGSNHNGNIETAKNLIDAAVEAKADAVKFQIYTAEGLYSKYTPKFTKDNGENPYELIKSIETPREWIQELAKYCKEKGILFLATPFDHEAVDILDEYVTAYKVASFEIVDLDLLKYIAKKGKPVICSVGMASLCEIEEAIEAIKQGNNENIVLLHCNSLYPTPVHIVNLKAIETLKMAFKLPVGFSDHTLGVYMPVAAIALGACVIEKHYTLSRKMKGPDHPFAIEPNELKEMVQYIRDVEKAMGTGIKGVSELEKEENYTKARRSIQAKRDIRKGTKITEDMLIIKRPGYGIKPKFIGIVIGREARKDIKADQWITWDMV